MSKTENFTVCKHQFPNGMCSLSPLSNEYKAYCVEAPCPFEYQVEYAPVVRCKDCKHCEDRKKYLRCVRCGFSAGHEVMPDDFCSYGERSE